MPLLFKILIILFVIALVLQYWPLVVLALALLGVFIYKLRKESAATQEKKNRERPRVGDPYDKVLEYAKAFGADAPWESKAMNVNPIISVNMDWFDDREKYYVAFHFDDDAKLQFIQFLIEEQITLDTYQKKDESQLLKLPKIIRGLNSMYGIVFDAFVTRDGQRFGRSDTYPATVNLGLRYKRKDQYNYDFHQSFEEYYCQYAMRLFPRYPE